MLYVTVPKKLIKELVSKLGRKNKLVDGFIKGRPGFRDMFFAEVGKDVKPGREIMPKSLFESMTKAAGVEVPGLKDPRQLRRFDTGKSQDLSTQKIKVHEFEREGEFSVPKAERREQARKESAFAGKQNLADRKAYLDSYREAKTYVDEFFADRAANPRVNWQKRRRS